VQFGFEIKKPIVQAQVTGVLTKNGRPIAPDIFDAVFTEKGSGF